MLSGDESLNVENGEKGVGVLLSQSFTIFYLLKLFL